MTDTTELDTHVTIEDVQAALGPHAPEFISAMLTIEDILKNPQVYHGHHALAAAARLAALRTKIGVLAQMYKTSERSIVTRRRKDIMLTMFNALEENINTLKLLGRVEVAM